MSTLAAKPSERKPELFTGPKGNRVTVRLEPLDCEHNGNHSYVWVHAEPQNLRLTPSTCRALARSLLAFAVQAEARRKNRPASHDMTSTGQGEISEEESS